MSLSSKFTRGGAVKSLVRCAGSYSYQYHDANGVEISEQAYLALINPNKQPASRFLNTPPAVNKPAATYKPVVKTSEQHYTELREEALEKALADEVSHMIVGGL